MTKKFGTRKPGKKAEVSPNKSPKPDKKEIIGIESFRLPAKGYKGNKTINKQLGPKRKRPAYNETNSIM